MTSITCPTSPSRTGYNYETYLRHLTEEGLKRRYAAGPMIRPSLARTEHELKIIHEMGFDVYYLIVWDLTMYARSRGIWWNVRARAPARSWPMPSASPTSTHCATS